MIKCTHCGCQLTSRLTVWVHVHSGSHECDGGVDIGVPIMDARGRIVYQDAPADLSSVAREAAERYVGVMDDPGELWVSGFTECASRLPSEEELAAAVGRALDDFPDSETFDTCRSYADQEADCVASAVLALIGERIAP